MRAGTYTIETCNTEAWAFVSADAKNAQLARDVGNIVIRSTSPKSPAVPYFHLAVSAARSSGPASDKTVKDICSTDMLGDAVASAMQLDASVAVVAKARELAFDWCWPQLNNEELVKNLVETKNGMTNACPGLLAKKAITGTREKKCRDLGK